MTQLRHAIDCKRGAGLKRYTGPHGEQLECCRSCGRFRSLEAEDTSQTPPMDEPRHDVPLGYRCREHGTPVNWRGRGCADCAQPRTTQRERRAARRANRQGATWQ